MFCLRSTRFLAYLYVTKQKGTNMATELKAMQDYINVDVSQARIRVKTLILALQNINVI